MGCHLPTGWHHLPTGWQREHWQSEFDGDGHLGYVTERLSYCAVNRCLADGSAPLLHMSEEPRGGSVQNCG